jgi:hypothetical protein
VSPIVALAPLFIPSPSQNVWYLGPLPLRAYALCIIAGIVVGMIIATRRWRARGGTSDGLESVVVLAVPFGIVGARIYHVITDYELYFGPGRNPVDAFKIWQGGLGIWGAVALGAFGGWLVARRRGIRFPALLDACAPGLAVAQGIGRLGKTLIATAPYAGAAPGPTPSCGSGLVRSRPGHRCAAVEDGAAEEGRGEGGPPARVPRPGGIDPPRRAQVVWCVAVACVTSDGAGRARTESDGGRPALSQQR